MRVGPTPQMARIRRIRGWIGFERPLVQFIPKLIMRDKRHDLRDPTAVLVAWVVSAGVAGFMLCRDLRAALSLIARHAEPTRYRALQGVIGARFRGGWGV